MRHIKAAALVVVVLTLLAETVLAEDYLTETVQALQQAPVYVAPGTEGTDNDTAGKLQARLNSDDNIVLVMLPTAAETELDMDIFTIASRLSEKLENKRIIGLAVGKKVVGYAPTLPAGVAADQMRRAESVSNDPVTALGTFVQNVHIWESENPQLKPTPIGSSQKGGDFSWILWFAVLIGGFLGIGFVVNVIRLLTSKADVEKTHFKAPTHKVSELLTLIARLRPQVQDEELKQSIIQICKDTEIYFQKYSSDTKHDAIQFENHLRGILDVITKYLEVQNFERYYDSPARLLKQGKEAIQDFAVYVLTSCRRGSAASLLDYTVNTQILQAQRYR